ncbi:MAG TPA: cob(I)yrinic acid a,c-diamide adenosyltransferase [bacterium]|nr:cob(I)yrinic acid a,c-diamide adenosyltransferase [bacterium]HPN35739.1 cob(I)yrinic acid a,c-diamide adenosyltransferase [bacterium]
MKTGRKSTRSITTALGDDGATAFIGGKRVAKSGVRAHACGDVDEASAWIGLVRSRTTPSGLSRSLLRIQNHLYLINCELAFSQGRSQAKSCLTRNHLTWLNQAARKTEADLHLPHQFILYGETESSAFLDVARAVVRRAERNVAALHQAEPLSNRTILAYLNRLSDYLYLLARKEETRMGVSSRRAERKA